MNIMQTALFLLVSAWTCLFFLPACSQKNTDDPPAGWKTLTRENYTIRYPDSLEVDESGKLGVRFFLYFPNESLEDRFRENINLTTEDLQGRDITLDDYAELSIRQIKNYIPEAEIIEKSVETDKEGNRYYRLMFSGVQGIGSGTDGGYNPRFELTFLQHYKIAGGKAYVLTLTGERHRFADYQKTGEQIMSTFRID